MGQCAVKHCLLLFAVAAVFRNAKCKRIPLNVAGFIPMKHGIREGAIGRGVWPAVQLALKHINSDPNVLKDYNLSITQIDSQCDPAVGMKAFFDMIDAPPKELMLLGDACTNVNEPVAKALKFFNLIQLSYAEFHPQFKSESYPNFYRLLPSDSAFNPARIALLKRYNWTKVGTLSENNKRYDPPLRTLHNELEQVGIKYMHSRTISQEDEEIDLAKMKSEGFRIIVGNFGEESAKKIFCEAYKHGMYGRKYQWIIAGDFGEKWWLFGNDTSVECTRNQLLEAMDGYILTDALTLSSSSDVTVSGSTPAEYLKEYNQMRGNEYSKFHGYAYDGMWAIAYALDFAAKSLATQQTSASLQDFNYRVDFWSNLFRGVLNETFFTGVTGNVSFDGTERRGSVVLRQFQSGREVIIGEYHSTTNILDLDVGEKISWRGAQKPPVDAVSKLVVPSRISLTLFIVISIFAVMGIVLALVFLSMNIKYRKQRYIKMSSPYLNNLIIIGCILTYTSVILLGLDSRLLSEDNFPYICAARAWVLMSGFTLAFGSMFSKTWRVHAIFTNIKLNKKVIKDYKLFMVVGILVFIDVVTLTTWQFLDPFYRGTHLGNPKPSPKNEDVHIIPLMEFCDSRRMTIFLGSIYVYKGLLMAFGCFLAWETRHVSIPALNDSKYIGMSVYNVVIMCVIGAGLSFVLKEQQDAAFVIISIFIIFCSTATLCLVFVPKLIELKRNPNMDERRVRPTLKPLKKSRKESNEMELHQRVKVVTEFNTRQKQRLKEKTFELEALMFRLRQYGIEMGVQNPQIAEVKISPTSCTANSKTHHLPEAKRFPSEKQIWLLFTEKESSTITKSEKETSFFSLSASPSFYSSAEDSGGTIQKKGPNSCPELPKSDELLEENDTKNRKQQTSKNKNLVLAESLKKSSSPSSSKSSPEATLAESIRTASCEKKRLSPESKSPKMRRQSSEAGRKPQNAIIVFSTDETSYSLAIKASINEQAFNGFSSSCEEDDTEKCDQNTFSEESEHSGQLKAPDANRRRAQSLSALQFKPENAAFRGSNSGCDSVTSINRHSNPTKSTFPFLSSLGSKGNINQDIISNSPIFSSSYPSVKCDIVAYL